jgi:hypothetical protein
MLFLAIFSILLGLNCNNHGPSDPDSPQKPLQKGSEDLYNPIDSIIMKVDGQLTYKLFVYKDNMYQLKVNNSDSIIIGPFVWEHANSKGLVFEDMTTSSYLKVSENVYYLCIPFGMGDYYLINVYEKDGNYRIDKEKSNWIFSEARYLIISKSNEIAVPIIRRQDIGMVYYWDYEDNLNKLVLVRKKYIDHDLSDTYNTLLDDPKYIKKIVSDL